MRYLVLAILLLCDLANTEEIPPEGLIEDYCLPDGTCGKSIRIPTSLPEGFTREPDCNKALVCVNKNLSMVYSKFIELKNLILQDEKEEEIHQIRLSEVMSGIYVAKVYGNAKGGRSGYGYGSNYLIERNNSGFSVLRKQFWVE